MNDEDVFAATQLLALRSFGCQRGGWSVEEGGDFTILGDSTAPGLSCDVVVVGSPLILTGGSSDSLCASQSSSSKGLKEGIGRNGVEASSKAFKKGIGRKRKTVDCADVDCEDVPLKKKGQSVLNRTLSSKEEGATTEERSGGEASIKAKPRHRFRAIAELMALGHPCCPKTSHSSLDFSRPVLHYNLPQVVNKL